MRPDPDARSRSVAEALDAVRDSARSLPPRVVGLSDALGLALAEDVTADLDLPPFDKALVDGFAVRAVDVSGAESACLRVVEEVFAGQTPARPVGPGEAAAIMTGAPLPAGADAVVMVEKTTRRDPDAVLVPGPVVPGQNRLVRGREMRAGEVVMPRGTILDAAKLGVMASVGASRCLVRPRPLVAVAATGDELVPFNSVPGPGQIRDSNSVMLAAMVVEQGATARPLPIIPDRPEALVLAFSQALHRDRADVLLVSGGVSAGRRDLVPEALEAVGVRRVFHKVRVKPGKPLWFGVGPDRDHGPPALVFGLPGNPVSGLVSFLLFVRPALDLLSGIGENLTPAATYPLISPFRQSDDRDTYRPARLVANGPLVQVEPLAWAGSADLRAAALADGFAIFPAGERMYEEGEHVGFLPLRPSRIRPGFSY